MNIKLKLYATLSDHLPKEARGTNEVMLNVPEHMTVGKLIEQHHLPRKAVHLVLLNGHFVPPAEREAHVLRQGDVLAIWPPVAGG